MASPQPKARPPPMSSLHDIVLDYVINSAYSGTARVLANSAGPMRRSSSAQSGAAGASASASNGAQRGRDPTDIDMDVDADVDPEADADDERPPRTLDAAALASIDERRAILDHILNGAVIRAVDSLHAHFPAVLTPPPPVPASAQRNGSSSNGVSASNGASSNGATTGTASPHVLPPPPRDASGGTTPAPHDHAEPVFARSTDPEHVRLNLQIQEFIESFRQLDSAPPSPASSGGMLDSTAAGVSSTLADSVGSIGSAGLGGAALEAALQALHRLHEEAKRLRPAHRARYLQEIKDVGGLFAYTDPGSSIVSGFLHQTRRIALAQQVNAAILKSEGRPAQSELEQIARRTSAVYATLSEHGIDPQPWTGDGKGAAQHWRIAQQLKSRPFGEGRFDLHEYVREMS